MFVVIWSKNELIRGWECGVRKAASDGVTAGPISRFCERAWESLAADSGKLALLGYLVSFLVQHSRQVALLTTDRDQQCLLLEHLPSNSPLLLSLETWSPSSVIIRTTGDRHCDGSTQSLVKTLLTASFRPLLIPTRTLVFSVENMANASRRSNGVAYYGFIKWNRTPCLLSRKPHGQFKGSLITPLLTPITRASSRNAAQLRHGRRPLHDYAR